MTRDPELDVIGKLVQRVIALEERVDKLESFEYPTVIIKTTTGDPATGYTGQFVVNTFDNKYKGWADGAWRELATW